MPTDLGPTRRLLAAGVIGLVGIVLMAAAASAIAQTASPTPGVAFDLAARRAALVGDLSYELALSIPRLQTERVSGTIRLRFRLVDATEPLVIDFDTTRDHLRTVRANGKLIEVDFVNGHLVVPVGVLTNGPNELHVEFIAGDAPLNRHGDFLYSLFVPARARQAIPCFDQPNLKGRWTISLEYPEPWQSVSNGREIERTTADARTKVRFAETPPLPTYLVSFVVGEFKVETAVRDGRTMRFFHRETDSAKLARNLDAVFDLHAIALKEAERYTAIPYPFEKLDFVAIPAFPFNAMEHAGIVAYRASNLLLDESASQRALLVRAHNIAHEVAHAWFGNLVTMAWFDDVWTKEVFANFLAAKIVSPSFPSMNHELRFFLDHYPGAYDEDRTAGAGPVRQQLSNLADAGSLYTLIIYMKSPVAMRHMESLLGEEEFRDGLRDYLRAHAFGNATWSDLIDVLAPRAPIDIKQWSAAWIDAAGRPAVITELEEEKGRIKRLSLRQRDERGRGIIWPQRLKVSIGGTSGSETVAVLLSGEVVEVGDAVGKSVPTYILPSAGGWGYGDFVIDRRSLGHLVKALPTIAGPLERGSAWVTLWDAMLDGRLAPERMFDLGLRAVASESDEQLAALMLGNMADLWWRSLGPSQRAARASRLETSLRRGLTAAPTATRKAAWFRAVVSTATTSSTVRWLHEVWAQRATIDGLPLSEPDYTRLAFELAIRGVPEWREVLDTQSHRIQNPDRKAQFEFVRPAVGANGQERTRWFEALRGTEGRRQERWVLEGLGYLHHPLRAQNSLVFIRPSLDLLTEIHATSNLGFPSRWVERTLSGHNSPEAAIIVRQFLDGLSTDYPVHLKNSTLIASDMLFRATKVRRYDSWGR